MMISMCLGSEKQTTHGVFVSHDTIQQCDFFLVTMISTQHSTDLRVVQVFRNPLQIVVRPPLSRSRHRGKTI